MVDTKAVEHNAVHEDALVGDRADADADTGSMDGPEESNGRGIRSAAGLIDEEAPKGGYDARASW